MSKSYEQLEGAAGRQRFFRPARHDARTLFADEPPVVLFGEVSFRLENISASGVGCVCDDASLEAGTKGLLRLTQRGEELFSSDAVLARCEEASGGAFAGIALGRGVFDLPALQVKNARIAGLQSFREPYEAAAPADYKEFCADLLSFLASCKARIRKYYGEIEASLGDREKNEIAVELAEAVREPWLELLFRGNAFALAFADDAKTKAAAKTFTEGVVTPALLDGEGWARSYRKPLGYPGDYTIMNYIYDGGPVGDGIVSKFLHMLSLIGSHPVRDRMAYLAAAISDRIRRFDGAQFNLLSIGAGPARELNDLSIDALAGKSVRATLIDQETAALEHAVASIRGRLSGAGVEAVALNTSFKEMLNPAGNAALFADQDIIYSAGLVDYLNPLLSQRFVQRVYRFLKPGGVLIIGNLSNHPQGMIWPSEYITDWSLHFRSEQDMREMATQVPDARVSIDSDPQKAIYFLIVERPVTN